MESAVFYFDHRFHIFSLFLSSLSRYIAYNVSLSFNRKALVLLIFKMYN